MIIKQIVINEYASKFIEEFKILAARRSAEKPLFVYLNPAGNDRYYKNN